jgi:hypothetical protein
VRALRECSGGKKGPGERHRGQPPLADGGCEPQRGSGPRVVDPGCCIIGTVLPSKANGPIPAPLYTSVGDRTFPFRRALAKNEKL